jgi:hypothetical protein
MTFKLNFFSSLRDIKSDLIKYFKIPTTGVITFLIKGHIDENTEVDIHTMRSIKDGSSEFIIFVWRRNSVGGKYQVTAQDIEFGDDVHIGMVNIIGSL